MSETTPPPPPEQTAPTVPAAPPPVAKGGSTAGRALVGCGVFGLVSAVLCCGCSGVLAAMFPSMAQSWLFEDHPLPGPTTEANPAAYAAAAKQACDAFAAGEETAVEPVEFARALLGAGDSGISVLRITADGPQATMDLSWATPDAPDLWLNVHTRGTFGMDHGWFTALRVDEFVLSGHDLGPYLSGQDLTPNANQSLANERAKNPDLGPMLDSVERFEVRGGMFVVKLTPDGLARSVVCDGMAMPGLVPDGGEVPALE